MQQLLDALHCYRRRQRGFTRRASSPSNFSRNWTIIPAMKSSFLLLACLLMFTRWPTTAQAEDKDAARAAFAEGRRRYDLNEFDAALEAFKRAYLAYEDPAFLYNIAQCHRQLGNRSEAVKFYRSYLRRVPDAPNRDEVKSIVSNLESELSSEKAAQRSAAAPVPPSPTAPTSAPSVTAPATTLATSPPPHERTRTPVYKKWWLWTVVGVVAAGAAAGIAVGITSQRTENALMPLTVSR